MKALIAMSGGVDSSVAAALAIKKGYDCIGVTMRLFDRDGSEININNGGTGTEGSIGIVGNIDDADKDIKDAALAAARLGIPHMVYDLRQDFKEKIMAGFAECYLRGETPNPCTACNRYIKFGGLLEKARELLTGTNRKVIDIGEAVGYPNYSYFCQSFREYFGTSPERYRQERRLGDEPDGAFTGPDPR